MNFRLIILVLMFLPSCGPSLRETGIPTEGTVLSKREMGTGTKKKYYITLNFFTQPDKENPKEEKPKDTNRTVDEVINDLTIDVNMGDYQSTEIVVGSEQYNRYNEGDEVKLRYEKGNPVNVIIDE